MSNSEKIIRYLESISPERATNAEISHQLRIRPHQQVFQITRRLRKEGLIRGSKLGKEWSFWSQKKRTVQTSRPERRSVAKPTSQNTGALTPGQFEQHARSVMSKFFGVTLEERTVGKIRKKFDFVSLDGSVIGDAKYYKMVRGVSLPPAKFSVIAEHVWLLEKTDAKEQFLVFGNDRRVPVEWLKRYGKLCNKTKFYFLAENGRLERLNG